MSGYGNEGAHVGRSISSADPVNFRQPTPLQQQAAPAAPPATKRAARAGFVCEIDGLDDCENDEVASFWIERGMQLALQDFRSFVGLKRSGTIIDAGRHLGRWSYRGIKEQTK